MNHSVHSYLDKKIVSTQAVPGLLYGTHEYFITANKLPIRFQCPPCKVLIHKRDMLRLSFSSSDGKTYIDDLERVIKKTYLIIENNNKQRSIKWYHIGSRHSDETYSLNVVLQSGIKVYDTFANEVNDVSDFTKERYIECILEIEKISLSGFYDTDGITAYNGRIQCSVLQIRVPHRADNVDIRALPSQLIGSLGAMGSETRTVSPLMKSSVNSFIKNAAYGKYFRMIQHGIPRMAVEQKIKMDGISVEILNYNPEDEVPESMLPLNQESSLFLEEIQHTKSTKLVYTEIQKSDHKARGHGISLAEIRKKLQSLKKTVLGGI